MKKLNNATTTDLLKRIKRDKELQKMILNSKNARAVTGRPAIIIPLINTAKELRESLVTDDDYEEEEEIFDALCLKEQARYLKYRMIDLDYMTCHAA